MVDKTPEPARHEKLANLNIERLYDEVFMDYFDFKKAQNPGEFDKKMTPKEIRKAQKKFSISMTAFNNRLVKPFSQDELKDLLEKDREISLKLAEVNRLYFANKRICDPFNPNELIEGESKKLYEQKDRLEKERDSLFESMLPRETS